MLDAWWEHGDLGEKTLVSRSGHDLVLISLGTAIGTYDNDGWSQVFDEMPSSAGDGKDICVGADIAEDL